MRDERNLIAKILVLAIACFFSACQKSGAENVDIAPSSVITPTLFSRNRFRWNGEKFVVQGAPELFDYDWTKQQKENVSNRPETQF